MKNNAMRDRFALPKIPPNEAPNIDDLEASAVSKQYLFIALQEINNSLRDIFISSLYKHGALSLDGKRCKKMLGLLNNKIGLLETTKRDSKIAKKEKATVKGDIKKLKNVAKYLDTKQNDRHLQDMD